METVELFSEVFIGEKNATFWKFTDKVDFSTDIVLGFSPTNYHSFLICKNIEFHPQFSYNPARIIPRRRESIRAGGFILLSGLEKRTVDEFYTYLLSQKNRRFPSCHMGVIWLLNEGLQLNLDSSRYTRYHPSQMVRELLTYGEAFNRRYINTKFYLLKDKSVEAFIQGINYFETKFHYGYWISDFYLFFWNFCHPNQARKKNYHE